MSGEQWLDQLDCCINRSMYKNDIILCCDERSVCKKIYDALVRETRTTAA
jgi:hypothetical protein